jgi:hypothetical protein
VATVSSAGNPSFNGVFTSLDGYMFTNSSAADIQYDGGLATWSMQIGVSAFYSAPAISGPWTNYYLSFSLLGVAPMPAVVVITNNNSSFSLVPHFNLMTYTNGVCVTNIFQ